MGGASRVITVDIAPQAIADAKAIFALNGLDVGRHGFEVADAFAWKPKEKQSFVVVDLHHWFETSRKFTGLKDTELCIDA